MMTVFGPPVPLDASDRVPSSERLTPAMTFTYEREAMDAERIAGSAKSAAAMSSIGARLSELYDKAPHCEFKPVATTPADDGLVDAVRDVTRVFQTDWGKDNARAASLVTT